MATMGLRPSFSALPTTNLVCGIGPSAASTKNDHAIDHGQNAFNFAAKVGMARRINDVDAGVVPDNGRCLGQNGDAALFFQIVGVHDALGHALVVAESAGLLEEFVNEGRFAMVNVRDDRDVADFHV